MGNLRYPTPPGAALLAALALWGAAAPLGAQNPRWSTTGPHCAAVLAVSFAGADSKRAYAASAVDPAILFVSNNNGATWQRADRQPRTRFEPIYDIDVHPTDDRIVWVAAEGVFKSEDRSRTWQNMSEGLPLPRTAWDLEIDANDPEVLHVLSRGQVYKTSDGGQHWRQISSAGLILDYLVHPRDSDLVWTSTDDGVFRTTNGGRSWAVTSDGLPRGGPLAIDPTASSTLYTAVRGYAYKTTNGRRWERLGAYGIDGGREARFVSIDPRKPSHLLIGVSNGDADEPGLWRSTDGGATWKPSGLVGEEPLSVARHPGKPRITLIGTTDSLYRSRQGGKRPVSSQVGLFGGRVAELAVVPPLAPTTDKPISYVGNSCGLYSRVHKQATWKLVERGTWYSQAALAVSPADPRFLYRGMRRPLDLFESIDVSADGGATWEVAVAWTNAPWALEVQASPADPMRVYATADRVGLYTSRDGGVTWSVPIAEPNSELMPRGIFPHPTEAETVYANSRGLVRSTDGGTSWQQVADFLVLDLAIDPARPGTLYALGDELYRSRDRGDSWTRVRFDLPPRATPNSIVLDGANSGTLYLAHSFGVLRSTNEGRTWTRFDKGLPEGMEIARSPHRRMELTSAGELLLATDRGVYVTRAR